MKPFVDPGSIAVAGVGDEGEHYGQDDALLDAHQNHHRRRDQGDPELPLAFLVDLLHALDVDERYADQKDHGG